MTLPRLRRRSASVTCTRGLCLIRAGAGQARVIQQGEHVHRNDSITRTHRASFHQRRWWHTIPRSAERR